MHSVVTDHILNRIGAHEVGHAISVVVFPPGRARIDHDGSTRVRLRTELGENSTILVTVLRRPDAPAIVAVDHTVLVSDLLPDRRCATRDIVYAARHRLIPPELAIDVVLIGCAEDHRLIGQEVSAADFKHLYAGLIDDELLSS
jgi:hypothetical protein